MLELKIFPFNKVFLSVRWELQEMYLDNNFNKSNSNSIKWKSYLCSFTPLKMYLHINVPILITISITKLTEPGKS